MIWLVEQKESGTWQIKTQLIVLPQKCDNLGYIEALTPQKLTGAWYYYFQGQRYNLNRALNLANQELILEWEYDGNSPIGLWRVMFRISSRCGVNYKYWRQYLEPALQIKIQ